MKKLQEYKQEKQRNNAYKEASRIQEGFALSTCSGIGRAGRQYEGHLAVQDVLSKIDSMNRMFESCVRDGSAQESGGKIISIIDNLYDLAQLKMAEAKKQAKDYMQKAAGIPAEEPVPEIEEPVEPPEEPPAEEPEVDLVEPEPSDEEGEEAMFSKFSPSDDEEELGVPSDSAESPDEIEAEI